MRRRANMRWGAEDEPCTRMYCLVQVDSRTYSVAARTFLLYDRAEVFIKLTPFGRTLTLDRRIPSSHHYIPGTQAWACHPGIHHETWPPQRQHQ